MQTLGSKADRDSIAKRISSLMPEDGRRWGKMSVDQMVCHLRDSYLIALGEKYVSPATSLLRRTIMKWFALRGPARWPRGVPTRPEIEQGIGGTAPIEFERDRALLVVIFDRFCEPAANFAPAHPFFGPMGRADWLRWGYLHADHHLRQFGR
jgi:hypothetical protein